MIAVCCGTGRAGGRGAAPGGSGGAPDGRPPAGVAGLPRDLPGCGTPGLPGCGTPGGPGFAGAAALGAGRDGRRSSPGAVGLLALRSRGRGAGCRGDGGLLPGEGHARGLRGGRCRGGGLCSRDGHAGRLRAGWPRYTGLRSGHGRRSGLGPGTAGAPGDPGCGWATTRPGTAGPGSPARSGARPAHSRRRFTSRACEK